MAWLTHVRTVNGNLVSLDKTDLYSQSPMIVTKKQKEFYSNNLRERK